MSVKKYHYNVISQTEEVTGSCHLLELHLPNDVTKKILLDCGEFQEKKYEKENLRLNFDPKDIDYVLLSHAHLDHVGRIPYLYKKGYTKKVYCSEITKELSAIGLYNTAFILNPSQKRLKYSKCLFNFLYDNNDVNESLDNFIGVPFNKMIRLDENISFMLLGNGHILGAACIYIRVNYEGLPDLNLLYTGDYAAANAFFDVTEIPAEIFEKPVHILCESTYGASKKEANPPVLKDIFDDLTKRNMKIVCMAFALERHARACSFIKNYLKENLKLDYPTYMDGLTAKSYNNIFINHSKELKKDMRHFIPNNATYLSKRVDREALIKKNKPFFLVTPSGMGTNGPANYYINELASRSDVAFVFLGYLTDDSLGKQLMNTQKGNTILLPNKKELHVNAEIYQTSEFSSHANKNGLLKFLRKFKNIRSLGITHGQQIARDMMKEACFNANICKDTYTLQAGNAYRIAHHGLIKTYIFKYKVA